MASKKRFIAGAVCPKCQCIDTLRWWREAQVEALECVACAHSERTSSEGSSKHQAPIEDTQHLIGLFKPR